MTQSDLTTRIDEQLKATEGHTPGLWVADYVGDNSYLVSSVTPGTIDGNLRQVGLITHMPDDARMEDAALIASAPALRALLVESAARIRDLEAQIAAQAEALAKVREEVRELDLAVTAFYVCTSDRSQSSGFKALLNRIARIKRTLWPALGAQS